MSDLEITPETREQVQKRYKTAAFIVLAQVGFSLLLIPVAWFMAAKVENAVAQESLNALWIAILFIAIVTFVLRRMFFRWDRLKDIYLIKGMSGLLASLQTAVVVIGAMAQVISVMGFLATALGGVTFDILRASVVALVVYVVNFPRRPVWEKIAGGLEKV